MVTAGRLHPVVRYTPETPVHTGNTGTRRLPQPIRTNIVVRQTLQPWALRVKHAIKPNILLQVFKNKVRLNKKEENLVQVLSQFLRVVVSVI